LCANSKEEIARHKGEINLMGIFDKWHMNCDKLSSSLLSLCYKKIGLYIHEDVDEMTQTYQHQSTNKFVQIGAIKKIMN
jgi:hypothetical protein